MKLVHQYLNKRRQVTELKDEIEELEGNEEIKVEIAFVTEIEAVLERHNKIWDDLKEYMPKDSPKKVTLEIEGKKHTVAVKGRFPVEVKKIFEASGMTRGSFVEKYLVK